MVVAAAVRGRPAVRGSRASLVSGSIKMRSAFSKAAALGCILCAGLTGTARPVPTPPQNASVRSLSGQFIVRAWQGSTQPAASTTVTNRNFIHLEPTLVAISCERIRQFLLHDLSAGNMWRDKIFLTLYPTASMSEPVTILSERVSGGWQYSVGLADTLERVQYVRAVVRVLLLEFANRSAQRSSDIPAWLGEGFTQQLLAWKENEIILQPALADPKGHLALVSINVSARRDSPLEKAHKTLQGRPLLSFDALSWPAEEQWSGEAGEVYRCHAQLFLSELFQLENGRNSLRSMLSDLSRYENWQFAFLNAFHDQFPRILDVEKWWALQLVHFTGRELLAQTWSCDESRQKLDEALHASIEIHAGTNELPLHANVRLQEVIRDWDSARQVTCLEDRMREIELLRPRLDQEFTGFVDNYCQALRSYLQHRNKTGLSRLFGQEAARNRAEEEVLKRLDELDAIRAAVRPSKKPVSAHQP